MNGIKLIFLFTLIGISIGQNPTIDEYQSSSSEGPSSKGGETAEYIYEYYDEPPPDYAVYPPKPKTNTFIIQENNQGRSVANNNQRQKFQHTKNLKESQSDLISPSNPEEYEYVYEEIPSSEIKTTEVEDPIPSSEINTKVSVSVSSNSSPSSTSSPIQPTINKPDSGIVISVATTKSIFNPTTSPTTIITSTLSTTTTEKKVKTTSTTVKPEVSSSTTAPTTTTTGSVIEGIKFEDVSKFLPPDYKNKSPILPKIHFAEISPNFLPKDYIMPTSTSSSTTPKPSTTTTVPPSSTSTVESTRESTVTSKELSPLEALMKKIRFEDNIEGFLPPGYNQLTSTTTNKPSTTTETPSVSSTTTGIPRVVFPTRIGFKNKRPTTTEKPKAEISTTQKINLKQGWPTRKTTEFTGWPTVSTTTPIPPSSTASTTTIPTTTIPTSTTIKTTTELPPPKPNPNTFCSDHYCKMEATMRLIDGIKWIPEYGDINTEEYKILENTVKRELDGAYRSSGLAPFYKSIQIESFNEGSVLVDYFLFLDNIDREISSQQIKSLFHGTLLRGGDGSDNYKLKLGRYTIDTRFTDFRVNSIDPESGSSVELDESLIPQWGIAVIVIGIASFIFVIIFGVTLVVSRQRKGVGGSVIKKGVVGGGSSGGITQEMLNQFNKTNSWNRDSIEFYSEGRERDGWGDDDFNYSRQIPQRSTISTNNSRYNIYDSWKTEWNGYPKGKQRDYDTNF